MPSETANITASDAVLIERYRQGNSEAMDVLILKYQDRIYNLVLKMCSNTDDAAELTQEALFKAINNLDSFEGRSSFLTWLSRIAINLTINYCQKRNKHKSISLDAEYTNNNQAKTALKKYLCDNNSPEPSVIAQNKELYQIVVNLLMKLDTGQRAAILLRDVEGMNYAQIATVLDIKLGTVKSRINRARNMLREIVDVMLYNNVAKEATCLSITE